jgi:hypothetical protein
MSSTILIRQHLIVFILFVNIALGQSSIVAAGNETYTIGETFPIMQSVDTIVEEVSLGVPKWEVPTEIKTTPKKKVSFLQSIINFLKTIFKQK